MDHVCVSPTWGLFERPVLRPAVGRSTQQSDRQHIGVVKVSAVLVDVTPELVEEPVPTGTTGDDGDTEYISPPVWQTVLGSGLSVREEAAPGVDCYDSVVGEPTSACLDSAVGFVGLAGGVTVGVTSPTDLTKDVTIKVTALADAGVASPAVAGVASLAVAGVASLADSAEVVSSAGVAGNVAVGVTFLGDPVGVVTEEMMGVVLWMVQFATVLTVAMGAWIIGMVKIRVIGVVPRWDAFGRPGRCYGQ